MVEKAPSQSALSHLRANLWLLVLTLAICCVLYPAAVWVVGQLLFHHQAQGSLVDRNGNPTDKESDAVGSTLIAQQFNAAWFFQERPSATSPTAYNAAASGGSNWAASNPKLRGRVATQLGAIARYSDAYTKQHTAAGGAEPSVQDDIAAWFNANTAATDPAKKRDLFSEWAANNPSIAQAWATGGWVTGGTWTKDYILQWAKKDHPEVANVWIWSQANPDEKHPWEWAKAHPQELDAFIKENPKGPKDPGADDLVSLFFASYWDHFPGKWPTAQTPSAWAGAHPDILKRWKEANPDKGDPNDDALVAFFPADSAAHPGDWPSAKAGEWLDADQKQVVTPDAAAGDIDGTFFDMWMTEQANANKLDPLKDFLQVPADMVLASGSGLDPDITLANAQYQEEQMVVPAYAGKIADDILGRDENKGLTDEQKKQKRDELVKKWTPEVKKGVDQALEGLPSRPMLGLTGDGPLVNVLQLNLRWQAEMAKIKY